MRLTIHRGAAEIGGSCVEIATDSTRILLDLGQPLSGAPGKLPPGAATVDAVLISHPHQDHFGLIEGLPDAVPVYLGEVSEKLMQATRVFLGQAPLANTFRHFAAWQPFAVGELRITPYLVDHSAADAYAFVIAGDGKRVMYSGDLRAHGRKAKLFEHMVRDPVPDLDVLLLEGTMLGRDNAAFPDEAAVEDAMLATMRNEPGLCFLIGSSQNFDRLVSAYRACRHAGRQLVVDIYTAWVLRQLSSSPATRSVPDLSWAHLRVLSRGATAGRHYVRVKENRDYFGSFVRELYDQRNVITEAELAAAPGAYLVKTACAEALVRRLQLVRATVIYSMWGGYLTPEHNPTGYASLNRLAHQPGITFAHIHTSGHAVVPDLQRLVAALQPKLLVPIHTEHGDAFARYFAGQRTMILNDGKELHL